MYPNKANKNENCIEVANEYLFSNLLTSLLPISFSILIVMCNMIYSPL